MIRSSAIRRREPGQGMDLNLPVEDSPYLLDEHGPIFVLGCPRSGTTFLSRCIGSVENVEEFVGILAPPRLMHLIGYKASLGEDVSTLLFVMRDVFWQSFWRRRYLLRERFMQPLRRRKSPLSVFQKPSLEGVLFCYKEPFLCFAVEQIAQHFPGSRFIHIIRDGRDAADSMERTYPNSLSDRVLTDERLVRNKNAEIGIYRTHDRYYLPWWIPQGEEDRFIGCSPYGRSVWMWKEMVSRVIECSRSIDSERYLELRYESVVSNPDAIAELILGFLGSEASGRLSRKLRKPRKVTVGIAKKRQSHETLDEATQIAGDLLRQLGYET
jgi:hypothetical protein